MTDLVIVVGPVSASQLGAVAWQRPTKVVSLSSGPERQDLDGVSRTIGPVAFRALWNQYGSVEAVAEANGIPSSELGAVGLVAFSAGWAFAEAALNTGRVDGALLLDACFTDEPHFSTLVKSGYRSFAARAARSDRLLVMTGGPGGRYHTGAACVWANVQGIDGTWSTWSPPTPVAPTQAMETGTLFVAEYGANVSHGGHVTTLGRSLANELLAPYLAGGPRTSSPPVGVLLAGIGGAVLAGIATFTLLRLSVHVFCPQRDNPSRAPRRACA
jgi:hypothetical protein